MRAREKQRENKYRGGTSDATTSLSLIVSLSFHDFLDAPLHLYKRSCPCYFRRKVCTIGASCAVYPA